ncbi:MAG: RNA polymerase sigma factor [Ignavibacteriales bacterium]
MRGGPIYELGEIDDWFARHVLPHEADLRRWLYRFAADLDIDDIVQETYAGMARYFGQVREPRAFMFSVARNAVIATLKQKRIVRIVAIADLDSIPLVDGAASSEESLVGREELEMLQAAIADLPDRCREVLTLRKIDGLPQREVAARLGLSESTVEKHVSAGIRRCAEWFARWRDAAQGASAPPPETRKLKP